MIHWIKPENFEKPKPYFLVVGYFEGKAIVKNQMGDLFYRVCEENEAPTGTITESDFLQKVETLSEEEQEEIRGIYLV